MGLKRANKNPKKKTNDNLIGFRTPTEKDKDDIKRMSESLGLSMYELVLAGIKAEAKPRTDRDLLYKKRSLIYERDSLIMEVQDLNKRIVAFNLQLKDADRFKDKYKDLSENDGVLFLYDEDGNLIE